MTERGKIKIWGRKDSSNVQKVLWCCDELGINYDRVDLGGAFGGPGTSTCPRAPGKTGSPVEITSATTPESEA